MSKTRNTLMIILSILLIPLTIFWLWNYLHNNSSLLEKLYHEDLQQVFQGTFLPVIKQPVINEKDHDLVVILTRKNFSSFIAENEYVMVDFNLDGYYRVEKYAREYEAAAAALLKTDGVAFARVDLRTEMQLARKYNRLIRQYPAMLLFSGRIPKLYNGDLHYKKQDDIVRWVRENIARVPFIKDRYDAEHVVDTDFMKVVGYYDTLEGADSKELFEASQLRPDIKFYQTVSPEVARIFQIDPKIKHPVLVQLKKLDEDFRQFVGSFTGSEIANFLSNDIRPHYTKARAAKSFETELWDGLDKGRRNSFGLGTGSYSIAPTSSPYVTKTEKRNDSFRKGTGSYSIAPPSILYKAESEGKQY